LPPFFNQPGSDSLINSADNEIDENIDNEIPEEKNAQSDEDGDDLLAEIHRYPSWITLPGVILAIHMPNYSGFETNRQGKKDMV
jgi:hypothetical protein